MLKQLAVCSIASFATGVLLFLGDVLVGKVSAAEYDRSCNCGGQCKGCTAGCTGTCVACCGCGGASSQCTNCYSPNLSCSFNQGDCSDPTSKGTASCGGGGFGGP